MRGEEKKKSENSAWQVPTRTAAASHWLRVAAHVMLRSLGALWGSAPRRHAPSNDLRNAPVIAEHRSPLWRDGRDDEFPLVAGKVENLRIAQSAFDGIVVRAGAVVSFWRQLGRPSRWRGFVEGREIRAGCVVPTIAGGLCQLSNALATCAVDGGLTLTERHGHTARVERDVGRDNPGAIDATVFWNYVDLRFVSDVDFRIEVELTSDDLVVRMRAADASRPIARKPPALIPIAAGPPGTPVARGCLTCDEIDCFRHRGRATRGGSTTAVLVDTWTPEFARHLGGLEGEADWFLPWIRPARRRAGWWTPAASSQQTVALVASLRRTLLFRRHAGEGGGRQAATLQGDRWLAHRYARRLEPRHTHLVVDQSLLVPLSQTGALAGRTYEVLVRALPASELQRRLDTAAGRWPDAASLADFRVSEAHCVAETEALRRAQRLVTPHAEVARHLRATFDGAVVEEIDWLLPTPSRERRAKVPLAARVVAFPASALARKGALEMAEAMRHLGWRLLVLGTPSTDPRLWHGIDVTHVAYRDPTWLASADVVALPAYIEHSPRGLLTAIAHGIPVVASLECGLPPSPHAIEVAAGDTAGLISGLQRAVQCTPC